MLTKVEKIEKKLAILGKGVSSKGSSASYKDRESRKEFWSKMMAAAEKDGDKLKASELLGRAEADFTDVMKHTGADGGPIQIQPMDITGLRDAIRTIRHEQSKLKLLEASN